ncbi:MAG: nuclear transport factor 2 family protein [Methanolinea sp.]|nr:nuclear transport factor 2 family protein [Methanolinea sp.]
MPASPQTCLQVIDTVDAFARCLGRGDVATATGYLDGRVSFIVPWTTGILRGSDTVGAYLAREAWRFRNIRLSGIEVDAVGTVAWVSGYFHAVPGAGAQGEAGHVTFVLAGTGHAWVIAHVHFSCPLGSARGGREKQG